MGAIQDYVLQKAEADKAQFLNYNTSRKEKNHGTRQMDLEREMELLQKKRLP